MEETSEELRRDSKLTTGESLTKRAPGRIPSAEKLAGAIERGRTLIEYMQDPNTVPKALRESRWNEWYDLETWGWTVNSGSYSNVANKDDELPDYTKVPGIRELVGEHHSDGQQLTIRHEKKAHVSGNYPPTYAFYTNAYFPTLGLIVAERNFGPRFQIDTQQTAKAWRGREDGCSMITLRQLSDIWWLSLKHLQKDPEVPIKLQHVVQRKVSLAESRNLIYYALMQRCPEINGRAPVYPGKVFEKGDKGFEALVGSDNVLSVPWLLVQRRETVGHLEIKRIRIWCEDPDGFYQPNLGIEIGAVTEAERSGS